MRAEGFDEKIDAFCGVTVVVGNEDKRTHVVRIEVLKLRGSEVKKLRGSEVKKLRGSEVIRNILRPKVQ
jgi:hypothetical protein